MVEDSNNPIQATIGDVFRVVNELRKTVEIVRTDQEVTRLDLNAMRVEQADFRASVESRLDGIDNRLGSQTESALNLALHVLGEQRGRLRELIDWANSKGARIERLP